MKFEADRADLVAALSKCLLATDPKSPHTAFKACQLETDGQDQVRFITSTETMAVDTVIPATVIEPGKFILSPHKLADMIAAMPKGAIKLHEAKGDTLTVKTGAMKRGYSLLRLTCEMHPIGDTPGTGITLGSKELLEAWDIVQPSVPTDEVDYRVPPAAALTVTKSDFALSGGCGRSLSKITCEASPKTLAPDGTKGIPKQPIAMKLPSRAFGVLRKMIADDERVTLYSDDRRVYLENGDTLAGVNLHAAELPAIDTVIDSWNPMRNTDTPSCELNAGDLVAALRAVSLPLDKAAEVTLTLDLEGTLKLTAASDEGSAEEEIGTIKCAGSFSAKVAASVAIPVLAPLGEANISVACLVDQGALYITTPTTPTTTIILMVISKKEK